MRGKQTARQVAICAIRVQKFHGVRPCQWRMSLNPACLRGSIFALSMSICNVPGDAIKSHLSNLQRSFELDDARLKSKYTPHLLAHIKQARRNKIVNKTRERQRERAGEVLKSTLRRRRKGVPAHIWAKMTDKDKLRDRLRRQIVKGAKSEG